MTLEKGPHVMDALLLRSSLNDREYLVWKLCGDLVHGEFHLVNVKDSNFGAS